MAGIGFTLKKLTEQNNIAGLFAAGFYSIFIACGPWLFTVLALSIIMTFGLQVVSANQLQEFQVILVYNFSFSYLFLGFYSLVIARYVSDKIYQNDFEEIPNIFYGSIIICFLVGTGAVSIFYFTVAKMELAVAISAIINFSVLSCIWHASIFMTVLKEFRMISTTFLVSLTMSVFLSLYLGYYFNLLGLLNGCSLGLSIIMSVLYISFYSNFNFPLKTPFKHLSYYFIKWKLVLCGILTNAGLWIDKWLMWFSPNSFTNKMNLVCDMDYSNAMFLASLSVVPSMAFFLFGTETLLDRELLNLFGSIRGKASLRQIYSIHKNMVSSIFNNLIMFIIIQGSISFICFIFAYKILNFFNIPIIQLDIFLFGILGNFYQFFTFYLVMMLYYFDRINSILVIYSVFFISNCIITIITIQLGFSYYGIGYFAASVIAFIIASFLTTIHLKNLIFHIFVTNNS